MSRHKVSIVTSSCVCENNDHVRCEAVETERIRNILVKKGYVPRHQHQHGIEYFITWVHPELKRTIYETHVLALDEI